MRPIRTDTQLAAIPAVGLVEVFQAPGNDKNNVKAGMPLSLLATAAGLAAQVSALDAQVAGGNYDTVDATVDGLGTGLIPATAQYVDYTVATDANDIMSLPIAVDGKVIRLLGVGCELRSVVAADKVNNVIVGATNEAALVAGVLYVLTYDAGTTNWRMTGLDALGAVTVPVVPDVV